MTASTPYDASVYIDQVAPSRRSADVVAAIVYDMLRPTSVIDAGCGAGAWLASFKALGAETIVGLEGGHPSEEVLQVPADVVRKVDLEQPFDAGARFDLAVSVEVAEHLPETSADTFVESFVGASDAVLFSAALPGQGGDWHINEQWPDYWSMRFGRHGYRCFDILRSEIWADENVAWWYRQNIMLFATAGAAQTLEAAGRVAVDTPRSLIHPVLFNMSQEALQHSRGIRESTRDLGRSVAKRLGRTGS